MGNNIQKKKKQANNVEHSAMLQVQQYSGPLPLPEQLEKYEEVLPGAAERIFKMAEENQKCEINYRNRLIKSQSRDALLGAVLSVVIIIVLFAFGSIILYLSKDMQGLSEIVTIISGFVSIVSGVVTIYQVFFSKQK